MLETQDLILRAGSEEDWEFLYQCFWSRPETFTYMFQKPSSTPEHAQKKTAAYADMHRHVPTEFFVYGKENGKPMGIAGIKALSPGIFTITDIAIAPMCHHRGYGKQILSALIQLGTLLGAEEILYNCFRENEASHRLAQACGFRYVKTEEAELQKNGNTVWMDHFMYKV